MPIFAKKKEKKYTFSNPASNPASGPVSNTGPKASAPPTSIEFQVRKWFRTKMWKEEGLNRKSENTQGNERAIVIFYKKFAAFEEEPLFLSLELVKRKGIDNGFKLCSCQASLPSGEYHGKGLTRESLLREIGDLPMGQFERDVNSRLGEDPLGSKSSSDATNSRAVPST